MTSSLTEPDIDFLHYSVASERNKSHRESKEYDFGRSREHATLQELTIDDIADSASSPEIV